MKHDFNINKIPLALLVSKGKENSIHHNRPHHGLAFFLGGEKIYQFESGEIITVKQNDIIYLPKHSHYTITTVCQGDCYAINFDFDEKVEFSPFSFHTKNGNIYIDCFKKAQKSWNTKKDGFTLNCKAQLYAILYSMQNEYSLEYIPESRYQLIIPAVEYIHQHYSMELLRIEKLASMCSITPEYFRSIFKNYYGISPNAYINNLKITKAKELLDSQMYSVTEAANQAGYVDMSHFSREFKKYFGVPPKEHIKALQKI